MIEIVIPVTVRPGHQKEEDVAYQVIDDHFHLGIRKENDRRHCNPTRGCAK
jgi:hypothetical protein